MSVVPNANVAAAFDLRSAALTLIVVVLRTTDLGALARELRDRFGDASDTFEGDPVAIDLAPVRDALEPIDFAALLVLLREHKMVPIAAKGGSAVQMAAALAAGLVEAPSGVPANASVAAPVDGAAAAEPVAQEAADDLVRAAPPAASAPRAMLVDRPLRSGQRVYAKGGDLVVLEVVSFGAEVIADGSIHVYAPLRGRAMAGALGDTAARIFTTCMEAQLVSIAGLYRSVDAALPADVLGKPAQVRLEGEKLVVEALKL